MYLVVVQGRADLIPKPNDCIKALPIVNPKDAQKAIATPKVVIPNLSNHYSK